MNWLPAHTERIKVKGGIATVYEKKKIIEISWHVNEI